jgi:mono/diheme cytochrome c family protein
MPTLERGARGEPLAFRRRIGYLVDDSARRFPPMLRWLALPAVFCLVLPFRAAESPATVEFERDVLPILQARCIGCHGPDKQRGGLRLDSAEAVLKGGDSGRVVVASKGNSPLLQRVTAGPDKRMPPTGEPLSPTQVTTLRAWIEQGAKTAEIKVAAETHWSFQPLRRPALPPVREIAWPSNPIDVFILAELEKRGLRPSPQADSATLCKRLYFDLIGLPPTPEQVEAFESSTIEKAVDALLASPHFGERWGRHWLDAVRFAESHGFEMNQPRPNAWRYRDWVIRALNVNMPYDKYVQAQLAGDALGEDAATGFLVAGPWDQVKSPDAVLTANQRADELHDIISTTGATFLGLTLGCARCHAHKFDPIPQADYYAVKAVFEGVQHGERDLPVPDLSSPRKRPPVRTGENVEQFAPTRAKFLRFVILATSGAEPCIDELEVFTPEGKNVALASTGTKATASGTYPNNAFHKLEHINDGRYGNERSWISNEAGKGWVQLEFPAEATIERVVWSRDRTQPPRYNDRLATRYRVEVSLDGRAWLPVADGEDRQQSGPASGARAYAGTFQQPGPTPRFHRGDPMQPREAVPPGALSQIGKQLSLPASTREQERRLALARWITSSDNPLSARVIVNRLWHHHFGIGLADTPSDLGKNGGKPSHPVLLDWLACELIDSGWDLKHIHRLIVLSATYRQQSQSRPEVVALDASNRLLWRYPPRRREAETLRDAILATVGRLDLRAGGPGFDLFEPNNNYVKVYKPKEIFGPDDFRRMVYWSKPRMQLDSTFGAFDCPDGGQITPRRNVSTTPLQALNLLNSPFLVQMAEAFAGRVRREVGDSSPSQVQRAFRLAFQRPPSPTEEQAALGLVREHGLAAICRALLNTNEFLFVD